MSLTPHHMAGPPPPHPFLSPLSLCFSARSVERDSSQDEPGRCCWVVFALSCLINPPGSARSPSEPAWGSDTCSLASIWSPSNTLAAVICRRISANGLISYRLCFILRSIIPISAAGLMHAVAVYVYWWWWWWGGDLSGGSGGREDQRTGGWMVLIQRQSSTVLGKPTEATK